MVAFESYILVLILGITDKVYLILLFSNDILVFSENFETGTVKEGHVNSGREDLLL